MAVAPRLQRLAGRWQIPLLAVSVGMLVTGLLQLRPAVPRHTFDDEIRRIRVALQAEEYPQASRLLTNLLNSQTDLAPAERAAAHRLLAETIYQAESFRFTHDPENARRILANFTVARRYGDPVQPADHRILAQAADWMGDIEQAVAGYEKALEEDPGDRLPLLERLIELRLAEPTRDWPRIEALIDRLIADAAGRPRSLLRAVQWKVQRLLDQDRIESAMDLVRSVESKLDVPPYSHHLNYFRALLLFRQDQYEAAEGRLRVLQSQLRRSEDLYAQTGWLLGQINYVENRPEIALSFYDEVARVHTGSEYATACLVGKAESLAALERYAAAAESYERAIDAIRGKPDSLLLDEPAVCQSLRTLAIALSRQGRPIEALPFARLAERLVPPEQETQLADLVELQARIHVQAAADILRRPEAAAPTEAAAPVGPAGPARPPAASEPAGEDPQDQARRHYVSAGELYARLARIRIPEADLAEDADWQSALCFDRAADVPRTIESLQEFVAHHPSSAQTPEALHRLGQALQKAGRSVEAIAAYQRLLDKFARTPAALASLVPLARCHIALGESGYERAERILLSVVEEDPSRDALFEPVAQEFRDALLELANLYMRWDRPERAIERLEQALALYPQDPEITRLEYQLADAYRRSGLALRDEADRARQPTQGDSLIREAHRRLGRARDLFDRVASRLDVAPGTPNEIEQIYLKTSYVYRADCAFDVGQYTQAAELYGRVAWRWQNDTVALSAYVQIVRSYLAAGEPEAARSALARARWILRKLPDSQFGQPPDMRDRAYWTDLFDWVEKSGLLASNQPGRAPAGVN